MTHDYKRNGTTTLFAALNMLDGTVIGECMPRHRQREFLRFLKTIDERTLRAYYCLTAAAFVFVAMLLLTGLHA
jgi:hypothetical protein